MTAPTPLRGPVALRGAGEHPAEVGGKGAWLDRLVAAGFDVPPTVVLGTDAYRAAVAVPPLRDLVDGLAAGALPDPEHHDEARALVDEAFTTTVLPDALATAIGRAGRAVRHPGGALAVRSSATAEDLHGTSFAGQYRSFLDVGEDDLERAVRLVWASLWHPAPRTYRRFHGIHERGLAMAVIVMHQVPADSAGVAFTVDPGGDPAAVRVEAVRGLGEQLVSGRVTPAVHLVPRAVAQGATPAAAPPPVDPDALEVARLALRVEASLGEPQDLEWARDGEGLWLLQTRPVTASGAADDSRAGDGADSADAASRRWTTSGIAEMLPGVLPPLRFEVCRLLVEEAIRAHAGSAGTLPASATGRRLLGRVRGRAVLDADVVEEMRRAGERAGGRRSAARALRAVRVRRRALWEAGTVCVAAHDLLDVLPDPAGLDDAALLALRRRVLDLAGRAMAAEVALAATAVAATARLEAALAAHLDTAEAAGWVRRVTARPGGTIAGWPGPALDRLLADAEPGPARVVRGAGTWGDVLAGLAATGAGAGLADAVVEELERAGSTAVFAGPTWAEQLAERWPVLHDAVAGGPGPDPAPAPDRDRDLDRAPHGDRDLDRAPASPTPLDDLLDGLAADPGWRQDRIRTLQVVDLRRVLLRRQAEDAADLLERRERTKSAVLSLGGVVRRLHLEAGRRLAARGLVEEPGDVELLSSRELVAGLSGDRADAPSWAELARRRRWLDRCEQAGPLPESFEGLPGEPAPPEAAGDVLRGLAASPGRMTGRARVLHGSTDGGLRRGDVLVASSTDASWAPLFMVAGAVVVEHGGPLSHAAIVARELGIPAVLDVPGAVALLDGADVDVTVDGTAGTVELGP